MTPRSPSGCAAACCSRATPTAHAVPWPSAMTWTSTWRAPVTTRSMNTVASPNALSPSERALSNASARPSSASTRRMPAPAAAGGRLDHQRVADLGGVDPCLLQRVDRPAAPWRHWHVGLLGEALGADLVAEPAHHIGAGSDERDAQPLAQLGELRSLGDEAPAHPRRVRHAPRRAPARAPRGRGSCRRGPRPRPTRARTSPCARRRCGGRWCGCPRRARRAARAPR